MTDTKHSAVAVTPINEMCEILERAYIKPVEYTDCAVIYSATFDQLRSLYDHGRSAIAASGPKPALTDDKIVAIAGRLPYKPWGIGSRRGDAIAFARAIEAASGPNAALVEALTEIIAYLTEPAGMTEAIAMDIKKMEAFFENLDKSRDATVAKARAALAAAGVDVKP